MRSLKPGSAGSQAHPAPPTRGNLSPKGTWAGGRRGLSGSARFDLGGRARLDLRARQLGDEAVGGADRAMIDFGERHIVELAAANDEDRKSTRLNSSH